MIFFYQQKQKIKILNIRVILRESYINKVNLPLNLLPFLSLFLEFETIWKSQKVFDCVCVLNLQNGIIVLNYVL